MIEVLTEIETSNQYVLRNGLGQQIYYAFEVSTGFARTFARKDRPFTIVLTNNFQQQVCRIHRPHAMFGGSRCMVESLLRVNIGYVSQLGTGFLCCDAAGQPFFQILAPLFAVETHPFQVFSVATMQQVGQIVKHYGGAWKEMCTDADTFSCHFPLNLNVQMKTVLVAAVFLVDFDYFEGTVIDKRNAFR